MMRRFSRRRRGGAGDVAINGERWFARMLEEKLIDLKSLEILPNETTVDVPEGYAAVGSGEDQDGNKVLVSFAPRSAGDALLGGLIIASKLAEEQEFAGELIVVAPQWTLAARRRLSLVAPKAYRVRALALPTLSESPVVVEPETVGEPGVVPVDAVGRHLERPADRDLFARATAALDGLASKHGGAIRGFERSVELVIMSRRVAELRADASGVVLNTVLPSRSSARLSSDGLAAALDALEGNLRKRLNDRRTREGDEGMRSRLQPLVADAMSLRSVVTWPVGGKDLDVIDSVGVNGEGSPTATAARSSLSLAAFGVILDAALDVRASLPVVLAGATAPVRFDLFRLALIATEFAPGVARLLPLLNLSHDLLEIRTSGRDKSLEVAVCGSGEAVPISSSRGRRGRGGQDRNRRPQRDEPSDDAAPEGDSAESQVVAKVESTVSDEPTPSPRGRGRRRGRGRAGGDRDGAGASADKTEQVGDDNGDDKPDGNRDGNREVQAADAGRDKPARPRPRFEEMSSFDLAEERPDDDAEGGRSRRRGRRSRGRRSGASESTSGEQESPVAEASEDGRGKRNGRKPGVTSGGGSSDDDETIDDDSIEATLSELPDTAEDLDLVVEPKYDDDDNDEEGGATEGAPRPRGRRQPKALEDKPVEAPKPVRRRVAIVAHADRDSVLAAVLLARELRLVEGIWVYTQAELMSFFRGGATDLRDETPIYVIGFSPSPARDVIQAAAIYSGRLTWVDHKEWPPEDLGALREALGEEQVWVSPGLGTSVPLMLKTFTRRSRFSDKLVDLAVGRFTEHDYERWGRVWWWRIGEIASASGSKLNDLEPLLAGRPSDLAKEAEASTVPPVPAEVDFVSTRDFRLVHFAGHRMVVLEVPENLDANLAARIARERYSAGLSIAVSEANEIVVVGGEEGAGRRTLDFGGLVDHLADKLSWVDALPDFDHVARFLLRDRIANPDRLDSVISEMVKGRSLLER
ncbi:MAG: hypothetical protein ACI9QQ_001636 [Myxococcota bacterium]|jgi:hypothetical protein